MGFADLLERFACRQLVQNQLGGDAVPTTTGLPIMTLGSDTINDFAIFPLPALWLTGYCLMLSLHRLALCQYKNRNTGAACVHIINESAHLREDSHFLCTNFIPILGTTSGIIISAKQSTTRFTFGYRLNVLKNIYSQRAAGRMREAASRSL